MFLCADPREIHPKGWLKRQLKTEASGLIGNLDKVWPDVRDSAWIGKDKEGWERVPYWLDAFIPLAYLLDDEDMKKRASRYVDAIIERQHPDGWICPCTDEEIKNYDIWAAFLIGKVLALYVSFTDDKKAEDALMRAMRNLYELLKSGTCTLNEWGKARWFEAYVPIEFLYRRHGGEWLLSLAAILREQGTDYSKLTERWKRPLNKWTFETHIVNMGMMLKTEAVERALFGKSDTDARFLESVLREYNGTAVGVYTGDECLSGISNIQGTELCAVAELMYSCEWLYRVTKDPFWAEQLEEVAFNAYPATFSDDMWTHQYVQMANQIECTVFPGRSLFRTNSAESHIFGLEPNYGCCTANGGQGWPKLAMHIFLKENENTFVIPTSLPAELDTDVDGCRIKLEINTEYPFRHTAAYAVTSEKPVHLTIKIRIPAWAKRVLLNGREYEGKDFITVSKEWNGKEEFLVSFDEEPHLVSRPHELFAAKWGPLVFSLPRRAKWTAHEYTRGGVERKFPYCDYSLTSEDEWQFGFSDGSLKMEEHPETDGYPFSSVSPKVTLKAHLSEIEWGMADGFDTVSAPVPESRTAKGESTEKELYPYGCAKLRMTELPMIADK